MRVTYGTPSYITVQSYTHFTVFLISWRQNCNPVLRGKSRCCKSWSPALSAHLLLAAFPFFDRLVPSGKISNHIGSRDWEPDMGPLCRLLSFCKRCWNRGLSFAHFRDRKTKP